MGISGRILDFILSELPPIDYVITNIVCCWPHLDDPDFPETTQPPPKSIEKCKPHLIELNEIYPADGFVLLGQVAANNFPRDDLPGPVVELLHPAALSREEHPLISTRIEIQKLKTWLNRFGKDRSRTG